MLITPDDRALIRVEAPTPGSNVPEAFAIVDSALVPATEDVRTRIIQSALSLGPPVAVTYTTADASALVRAFIDGVEYRLKPFSGLARQYTVLPVLCTPLHDRFEYSRPHDDNTPSDIGTQREAGSDLGARRQ